MEHVFDSAKHSDIILVHSSDIVWVPEEHLSHYGVKGMRWGKSSSGGTPRKTERAASKDAKEFAQAKMFYGEGAGIRRRQINNVVKDRSKDPAYKEAFDRNLASQNMAKASAKARSTRKRKDVVKSTRKTARGVNHILRGNAQYASAAAAVVVAGASYAHKQGIDKMLVDHGKKFARDAASSAAAAGVRDIFNKR